MSLAIVNGHVMDPASGLSEIANVLIDGTTIAKIGTKLTGTEVIDARDCIVCPGFVDLHVHFREPGQESKETIATGSRAAARGGFTSVVTMANTQPPIDNGGMIEFVHRRAREIACIKIWPAACATKGRAGQEMTEMAELKAVGAVAVTDDGSDIASSWVLRRVLEYANMCGLTYLAHCEDATLMEGGVMNEGYNSTKLGLPGLPKAMEEIRIDRNVRLAAMTGAKIHIQHVSTTEGLDIIRRAKERGVRVTCETAPHYWTLTDDAVTDYGTNAKMNPPLREAEDVAAIKQGLADGTIDCIATDHAPHTFSEKDVEFALAPFGIVGLETALGLILTGLVEPGTIPLERALALITSAPAQILGLPAGRLYEGGPADVTVFNPKTEWTVDPEQFASLSRNTPFAGHRLRGLVQASVCDGDVVYQLSK
ncbi:MAG: dihydroorotase [Candidatus Hydrogenedentes bacterium]|nr:dihydroorotase [Candidatus Hydrogenedentota bacterium]